MVEYSTSFISLQCHKNRPCIQWHFVVHLYTTLGVLSSCSHLPVQSHNCLIEFWLLTGWQILCGYLAGLLSILGPLNKSPLGVSKITMDRPRQFPQVSSIIPHSFCIGQPSVYTKVTQHTAFNNLTVSIALPAKEQRSKNWKEQLKSTPN